MPEMDPKKKPAPVAPAKAPAAGAPPAAAAAKKPGSLTSAGPSKTGTIPAKPSDLSMDGDGKGAGKRRRLGDVLIDLGMITLQQLKDALENQKVTGGALGAVLVEMGLITEDDIQIALGAQEGMEIVDLDGVEIPEEVILKIPATMAANYRIIPTKWDEGTQVLTVAMADIMNMQVLDELHFMLNVQIQGAISNEEAITNALNKYYSGAQSSLKNLIDQLSDAELQEVTSGPETGDDPEAEANKAPVVKFLNLILMQAIRDKASDIHLEPFENEFKIRYRIDGVLYEMMPPPRQLARALISRVKVLSKLDISETRMPQDGRIEFHVGKTPIDLRVSTLPTMFGESVVMRVLDKTSVGLDIAQVGMQDDELKVFLQVIQKPNGIVLVTGPTGSGKTTSLYAALNKLNTIDVKILTAEDPVEYDLPGINQVQIDDSADRTFSKVLRSFLRQDPDIILVGEIRDVETGQIAIQASLTGHIVFSTLHTNDAPSTITRLVDMGLEPFLICATLECILAQRLVRKICVDCKEDYEPTEDVLMELGLTLEAVGGKKFMYGKGCDICNNTGYKGRQAIFEMMVLNDEVRSLIMEGVSINAMRETARRYGMRTLREAGLLAIYDGRTTIEEVVKETQLGS